MIRLIRGSELIARSGDNESARTYYHYASDEMGSTTHIVDEQGNVQNRYTYAPGERSRAIIRCHGT